jgi:hypothetical protein
MGIAKWHRGDRAFSQEAGKESARIQLEARG